MGRWTGRISIAWRRLRRPSAALGLAALVCSGAVFGAMPRQRDIRYIVGKYEAPVVRLATPTPVPRTPRPTLLPQTPAPRPDPQFEPRALLAPAGAPPPSAKPFRVVTYIPGDLLFFAVIGSDARPGQDMTRARADSIHVVAVDPKSREGTIVGIPRDSYVEIPGHGMQKINAALVYGGPNLLVKVLRDLTKMPITHYAVTGFEGIDKIVDTLLGVDVYVPYRMEDSYSGANFSKGWHHMNGPEVLAFSRARHGVPGGDFGRSKNHGSVMVYALKKMRAETDSREDIKKWLDVLFRHAKLDMSIGEALKLGVLARKIIPSELVNLVVPGDARTVDGQSVVVLGDGAHQVFKDVRYDAVADGDTKRNEPKPDSAPPPKPKPTPTPGLLDTILATPAPERTARPTPR